MFSGSDHVTAGTVRLVDLLGIEDSIRYLKVYMHPLWLLTNPHVEQLLKSSELSSDLKNVDVTVGILLLSGIETEYKWGHFHSYLMTIIFDFKQAQTWDFPLVPPCWPTQRTCCNLVAIPAEIYAIASVLLINCDNLWFTRSGNVFSLLLLCFLTSKTWLIRRRVLLSFV